MKLNTIVVGTDFSPAAAQALAQAELIASQHEAQLVLVHASGLDDRGVALLEMAGRVDEPWKAYLDGRLTHSREQLVQLVDEVAARGQRVQPHFVEGHADRAVVEVAQEVGAELIVVGTRGHTGMQRWLLGSVAERIARQAETHVLVTRQPPTAFARVLVGTDFSPASALALDAARALVAAEGRIDLLHGYHEPLSVRDEAPAWLDASLREGASSAAENLLRDRSDERVHLEVMSGAPALTLRQRLDERAYDAVFLGSHGKRGLRRMLLGSVTEHTLRGAPCSVFVAHGQP